MTFFWSLLSSPIVTRFFDLEVKTGMSVSATKRETRRLKLMVRDMSRKIWPERPGTNRMGTKTATVVRVDAVMAMPTSDAPSIAALTAPSPSSLCLTMFSSTTMELSTSMPTDSASPAIEMMLRSMSTKYMTAKVAMTDIGMEMPTTALLLHDLRNTSSTTTVRRRA